MGIFDDIKETINNFFKETTTKYEKSNKWKEYKLGPTITHCVTCFKRQNKIYDINNIPILPEYIKCLCYLQWMRKVFIGNATDLGVVGADYYIVNYGILPNIILRKKKPKI